jgi:diaminohydroxyphosphoribosylaminopyrimidine deaminase/5-amino-6-(5-phosphoribosylamino)uracil reductase
VASAGICRVVAALEDPNPRVAGKGFAYLRERGIQVEVGEGRFQATRQNEAFFCWIERRRPFVIAKTAISADGFVGRSGSRVKLTGPTADTWFHRQRAEIDALAVGAATVIADDPLLTPRLVYRVRPLIRVLFDWRLRVPLNARVFSTRLAGPVIMIAARAVVDERRDHVAALRSAGVEIEAFPTRDLGPVLARLAERGMLSLLVEGGPTLQTVFARERFVDRVQRVTTRHVLGSGVPAPQLVDESIAASRVLQLGPDVLQEWDRPER